MDVRITSQTFSTQAIRNAQAHTARLAELQLQASTGLRIHKPSDDPIGVRNLITRQSQQAELDTELANIEQARSKLNLGVSQLLEANKILVRAKQVGLDGVQSTERETLAREVDGLLERLLSIANTKDDGQFLFAGNATGTVPFSLTSLAPETSLITADYAGTAEAASITLNSQLSVEVFYSGADVFQQRDRGETLILGPTGARPGLGTNSAAGQEILHVRHGSTTYAGGSGVQPGVSSAGGDTIIGPAGAHMLTINDTSGTGSSGTVALNGGGEVAFTSADTDLKVIGPGGELVFVDTTAIAAGFSGSVAITADGTLSTDSGVSEIAIDFSNNQIVTDSVSGQVTHIDSTDIRSAGIGFVEFQGTADAFQVLAELAADLRNERGLTEAELSDSLTRRLSDIERMSDAILASVGKQSVTLETLDDFQRIAEEQKLETQRLISEIESADISEVVIKLQEQQNLLQLTFASSVGLLEQSLLNFLN